MRSEYKEWLSDLKRRIKQSQIKASVRVNTEMLELYWGIGADIVERQAESKWGSGVIRRLSEDLRAEFPQMQGFSARNLKSMRRFYLFYAKDSIGQQVVAQLPPGANAPTNWTTSCCPITIGWNCPNCATSCCGIAGCINSATSCC
jgi:predicted nuclease of restriction endonuclease-like (RecB) superfamily